MPKTKGQGLVFGILMSVTMAYGMEVYNVALKSGVLQHVGGFSDMRNTVFLSALKEAAYMWVIVLVISLRLRSYTAYYLIQSSFSQKSAAASPGSPVRLQTGSKAAPWESSSTQYLPTWPAAAAPIDGPK